MEKNTLTSRIIKTESIRWRDLQFIQQDDFKEWAVNGDQKLQASLLRYQFIDPFKVWLHDGVLYCLDGRHRYMDLLAIAESGNDVPEMLPATFIDCRDKGEAAELVLIYSSRYARITHEGLLDFSKNYSLDLSAMALTIDLPDIDIPGFMGDLNRDFSELNGELDLTSFGNEVVMKLVFTREDYIEVKHRIEKLMKDNGHEKHEDVIKDLLFT